VVKEIKAACLNAAFSFLVGNPDYLIERQISAS
jgi:hypothetical protein